MRVAATSRVVYFLALALALACSDVEKAAPDAGPDLGEVIDPESCKECHPEHFAQWSGSMHAYAAEGPVFRAMLARALRDDPNLGDYCLRCHAPMAVILGMSVDGRNLDEVPQRARGVTCVFCHTIHPTEDIHTRLSLLQTDGVMHAGIRDPVETEAHGSGYAASLDRETPESSEMCGACHDFVAPSGDHVGGTYQQWQESVYADPDPFVGLSCGGCHMPARPGQASNVEGSPPRLVHDHSVPGVDVALNPFPNREVQRSAVEAALNPSLVAELCVRFVGQSGAEVEVYLENVGAGHDFPSGAPQYRRLWVELRAYTNGREMYQSGAVKDGEAVVLLDDPDLWLLADQVFDEDGVVSLWGTPDGPDTLLPAPTTPDPALPNYRNVHIAKRYVVAGEAPDRVTLSVHMRPFGLDLIDALIAAGDLDASVREAVPTFTLAGAELEWTEATATLRFSPLTGRETLCITR